MAGVLRGAHHAPRWTSTGTSTRRTRTPPSRCPRPGPTRTTPGTPGTQDADAGDAGDAGDADGTEPQDADNEKAAGPLAAGGADETLEVGTDTAAEADATHRTTDDAHLTTGSAEQPDEQPPRTPPRNLRSPCP